MNNDSSDHILNVWLCKSQKHDRDMKPSPWTLTHCGVSDVFLYLLPFFSVSCFLPAVLTGRFLQMSAAVCTLSIYCKSLFQTKGIQNDTKLLRATNEKNKQKTSV